MRAWLVLVAALAGCRGLLGIDDGRLLGDGGAEADADGAVPVDVPTCFGTGMVSLCLAAPPTAPRAFATTMFDTATACDQVVTLGSGLEVCVVAGSSISVSGAATLRAIGPRPLVLVAAGPITIDGTVSVSSQRTGATGAGAQASCIGQIAPQNSGGGAGGGAGGSYGGQGGAGGTGNLDGATASGGLAAAPAIPITPRGGCPGGRGGSGGGANTAAGGAGGGAVYLIATEPITITGAITANGAGGSGGVATDGGGGGGGAGGLVGFDAPVVAISGTVTANGGGGGEGAGNAGGTSGADGGATLQPAPGGAGIAANGGDGGDGAAGTAAGDAGANATGGGGGGGGGAGYIYVRSAAAMLAGTVSPAPSVQ